MYDAVIIGAGISGLVCGCYLAKAGMKVLIVEQHNKPGGYCTSFKRQGFTFDAAAHSLGGLRNGNLGKIFDYLGLNTKIEFNRFNPSNVVVAPDCKIAFWSSLDKTVEDFQRNFPDESNNIKSFFYLMANSDVKSSISTKGLTFYSLLGKYFNNYKLKSILTFPIFGNSGTPPWLISAFVGSKIFKEFLLDGGYYPKGGMQVLSDSLAEVFKNFGGELRFNCYAEKIRTKNNCVLGIVLKEGDFIQSKYVISNCDSNQTFKKLLQKNNIDRDFLTNLDHMLPSLSTFILYLGLDEYLCDSKELSIGTNIWMMYDYNLEGCYLFTEKGDFERISGYLLHIKPDKKSVVAFMNAPFKSQKYWTRNKLKLMKSFILRIESDYIPELSKHILYKGAATPQTLCRYTLNYKGSAFGWASTIDQLALTDFRKPSFVEGLYLTGHWTTKGLGIPGVVYIGFDTAKMILRKENNQNLNGIVI